MTGNALGEPKLASAVLEAELRAYHDRKRPMVLWSIGVTALAAAVLASRSPLGAVALGTGALCGILNALLSMRGNERLADHRVPAIFVLSSILRIGLFAIVPVEFARAGPAWTIAAYFLGFFTPLGLYAVLVARDIRTERN